MIKAQERPQSISLKLSANCGQRGLRLPHQINGSQRVGGGHVRPCPLDGLGGKLGLAQVVLTGCQGIPKSLPDDVLKVTVLGGMRTPSGVKEKPRRSEPIIEPPRPT